VSVFFWLWPWELLTTPLALRLLFLLLVGHSVADFALQNDFIATWKNPWLARPRHAVTGRPVGPSLPRALAGETVWPWILGSHALMQGAAVLLVTGSLALAIAETVAHALIDLGKCAGLFGFHADQALHVACKLLWWALWVGGFAA
jgi:hypothetical protein